MNNGFYEFSRGKQETTSSVFPYTGSAIITGSLGITGSLVNGQENTASGSYSHAEGLGTQAIGEYSHAEGRSTQATARYSHAEGSNTQAIGGHSHAEGNSTLAIGIGSHAEGFGTIAKGDCQHVQGQYNISSSQQSAFIIGNGTNDSNRSNLVFAVGNTVEITGSLNVSGSITGSLFGTSSWAISSSNALTASYALNASISGTIPHAIATGTDTYTATISGVTAYNDADAYLIRFTNGNTTGCTLNINGLGAVTLYRNNDGVLIGGDIINGGEMICIYNSSTNGFQVIGTAPNTLLGYVTNADSVTLTKGMPVYAFGGTGDRMTVKRAANIGDASSAQTVGLVLSTSIGVNQKGLIMMQGLLDGLSILPTSTWADGDPVYLGATPGTITNVKPYAPNHLVYLGVVTTASPGSAGRMYVRVQNGYELEELHNVRDTSTTSSFGDLLVKSGSLWTNSKQLTGSYGLTGSLSIQGNLQVLGTASFIYTTASIISVGTNVIVLNTDNPASRFGGITVIDSGSFGNSSTGSLFWDSQNNRWIYSNPSGSTYDGGMLISGPRNTSGLGNESGMDANYVAVGAGADHIRPGSIYNSGSGVSGITIISGTLAQGLNNVASGTYSHAQGEQTVSKGYGSHTEGYSTISSGSWSHTEGANTRAIGLYSHAEGASTRTGIQTAYSASVSTGIVTLSSTYGDISGEFTSGGYLYLYDGEFDDNYTRASFLIDVAYFTGTNTEIQLVDVTVTTTTAYVGDLLYLRDNLNWNGDQTIPGDGAHTEGVNSTALGIYSHAEGNFGQTLGAHSHAEGYYTQAIGNGSHAEGNTTKAVGDYSHAEGDSTVSTGLLSHAEGYGTISSGSHSHAEGQGTISLGLASHAEGYETISSGSYSHAEGNNTIAVGNFQHVQGQFNLTSSAESAFIIGNGTSNTNRSNLVFASGSTFEVTGSLNVSGSITGSLLGTSSYALTASYAMNGGGGSGGTSLGLVQAFTVGLQNIF